MTPYRDRLHNGEYQDPDNPPTQERIGSTTTKDLAGLGTGGQEPKAKRGYTRSPGKKTT